MTTPRSYVPLRFALRRPLSLMDFAVLVAVLVLLYAVRVGHGATASFSPAALQHVSTSPARLPYDAARSLLRMFIALFFSTVFTLVYGYAAARGRRAEKVLVPILDILQSVPVLGFLTITVTAFIALSPGTELGARGGFDLRDLHRPGMEHDVLVLRVAEEHAQGLGWFQSVLLLAVPRARRPSGCRTLPALHFQRPRWSRSSSRTVDSTSAGRLPRSLGT